MTAEQVIGFVLAILAMGISLIGTLIPVIPGTTLIFLIAVLHRLYFDAYGPANWVLAVLAGIALFSMGVDFLAGILGAKSLGATRLGMIGAVLGVIVGVFFSWPGLILGPFLGAFVFELLGKRSSEDATKAGFGAVLGLFLGVLGKMFCGLIMIILFSINVLARTLKWEWLF